MNRDRELEIRRDEMERVQKWIDENNVYQVEFGHYEDLGTKWIPLKTRRINIKEVFAQ